MRAYVPRAEARRLLDAAYDHVGSVPYRVSARWLFYRLLQDGLLPDKESYGKLLSLLSAARKRFYGHWRPDTLADDTRQVLALGGGYLTTADWLKALPKMVYGAADYWKRQPNYVLVCFEAAAMEGQFDHYLPRFVSRCAFKGDVSIPTKWAIAKLLERCARVYGKPIQVVYFGDYDPKGLTIPESAMADVRAWAKCPINYMRAGLNAGDEVTYQIPENPDRPGTYQWEGLDDARAGRLITSSVGRWLDLTASEATDDESRQRVTAFKDWWSEYGPSKDELGLDD